MDIGIFDSGLGGFSVLEPFLENFHQVNIHYLMDNHYLPYGDKSQEFLRERAVKIAEFFNKKACQYLILACNTITAAAYDVFLKEFSGETFGIIEYGARAVREESAKKVVGLLATKATVASRAYDEKFRQLAPNLVFYKQAAPRLVPYIEGRERSRSMTEELIREVVEPLEKQGVDLILLACTHYPSLQKEMEGLFPQITFINPATYLVDVLKDKIEDQGKAKYFIYMTEKRQDLLLRAPQLRGRQLIEEKISL